MSICTLKASPPCETTILIETKKSETILDLKSELLLKNTQLGQVSKLRPRYYSPKYGKVINQDYKQFNQCILYIFLAKIFHKNLESHI